MAEVEASRTITELSWHVVNVDERHRLVLEKYRQCAGLWVGAPIVSNSIDLSAGGPAWPITELSD